MARSNRGGYRRSARRGRAVKGYTLRARNGQIKYVGVSNNPARRAIEHKQAGKTGRMKVEIRHQTRASALRWERQRLTAYRKHHGGKNPPLNKTLSGSYR